MTSKGLSSDLRGVSRVTVAAVAGTVGLLEALNLNVAGVPWILGTTKRGRTTGLTGLVYRGMSAAVGVGGRGLDRLLARLVPELGEGSSWPGREALLAALNGVLGDFLDASGNQLAIRMCVRRDGKRLAMEAPKLATAIPPPGDRLLVLLHGLCMNDLQWRHRGHDHGAALARDLGYTPVYLLYNSGRHISVNGREFAEIIDKLLKAWPVPLKELVFIGHSMGGLVARSACHHAAKARHAWLHRLDKMIFLGTPHHGASLERAGNWVDMLLGASPYVAPFARLVQIRSSGITDLRYGNLLDKDWKGRDRFARRADRRRAVPLPEGVACYTIAATTGKHAGDVSDTLIGDGIVPLKSALGRHESPRLALAIPESRVWIGYGMNHLDLLSRKQVYAQIRQWLSPSRD